MVRTHEPFFPKDMNWGEFWVMFFSLCLLSLPMLAIGIYIKVSDALKGKTPADNQGGLHEI